MNAKSFQSEWITINDHRVLLECRISFPSERMKFIARVAVETCDSRSQKDARVVRVYYNDKVSMTSITIASTNPDDKILEENLTEVLETIFNCGNFETIVKIVESGNLASDRYDHMQYLSSKAGVLENK